MGFSSFFKTPPPQTDIERRRTVVCKSIYALCHIYEEQKKGVFRKYNTHTQTHTHTHKEMTTTTEDNNNNNNNNKDDDDDDINNINDDDDDDDRKEVLV